MRIERHLGELCAAHRLINHGGGCENLHGHNWNVHVWVEGNVDPRHGIAVDFLDFDRLREELMREFDHGIWLNREDPLIPILKDGGVKMKLVVVDGEPTAENMACLLMERLRKLFPLGSRYGVRIAEMQGCDAELVVEG